MPDSSSVRPKDGHEDEYILEDEEDSYKPVTNCLIIHNMSVIADTGVDLNLRESLKHFGNSMYDPTEFNCIRLDVRIKKEYDAFSRLPDSKGFDHIESIGVSEATKDLSISNVIANFHGSQIDECEIHRNQDSLSKDYTSVKVSVFSNGKLSVIGARSLLSATVALEKVCRALRRRVNKKARLNHISCSNILVVYHYPHKIILPKFNKVCKGSIYDPLRFYGVRVRFPINAPQVFYNLFKVLHMTKFSTKYSHLMEEENKSESENESEEFESDNEQEVVPIQMPTIPVQTQKRFKSSKFGIQRFVDSADSDKRKVHHSTGQVVVKRKKTILPKNVSIWTNTNLLKNESGDVSDPLAKVEESAFNRKEEVVTVNVFSSGNITFTGARSISSIQQALSHIFPYLQMSSQN